MASSISLLEIVDNSPRFGAKCLLEIVDNSLGFGAKYNDGVKLPWNNSEDSEQEGSIMKENIVKLINEQINAELYSA